MNAIPPVSKSRLRAVAPKAALPSKPKILIYGAPGVGKTWGATLFPSCYYVDTENGGNLPQYTDRLAEAGGAYMGQEQGALDFDTVINEVKTLATERHHFRTLIIDSISKLYGTSILHEQLRLGDRDAYGASKRPAVQKLRTLLDWVQRCDLNCIFIAHEKELWSDKGRDGFGPDIDPKLAYDLHLILHIQQRAGRRVAVIGKSRLSAFPTGESFDWSFETFAERYGREVLEAEAKPIVLASPDQVAEVKKLLDVVKVAPDFEEKCLAKASCSDWLEMDAEKVAKVIDSLKEKLAA